MICLGCGSERTMSVSGKTSDMCVVQENGKESKEGYVPRGMNIGGGDYLEFDFCMDCGRMEGVWPLPKEET